MFAVWTQNPQECPSTFKSEFMRFLLALYSSL